MARYIEANELVRKMTLQANRTMFGEIAPPQLSYSEMLEIIADTPTADVVPKIDVAKEFTCFVGDPHKVDHCPYLDEIEKAKTEVAREIFEEIEENYADFLFDGCRNIIVITEKDFTELRKKYTEDE